MKCMSWQLASPIIIIIILIIKHDYNLKNNGEWSKLSSTANGEWSSLVITLRTTPCSAGVRLKHLVWNFFTWLMEPFITLHASCHPLLTIIRITAWTINWNSLWLCSSRNYHLFWKRCKKFFLLGTPESETLTWFGHNDNLLDHCHMLSL